MAYHKSNLGSFGEGLMADMDGYVPEASDTDPWAFRLDHGSERTHHADGSLTEYGRWWEDEGYHEWQAEAVRRSDRAAAALRKWQDSNS